MSQFNQQIQRIAEALNSGYTKDILSRFFFPPAKKFTVSHLKLLKSEGADQVLLDMLLSGKTIPKFLLAQACALPFGSRKTYETFLGTLPEEVQVVWRELIWTETLNHTQIEKKFGIKVYDIVERSYPHSSYVSRDMILKKQFEIFQENGGHFYRSFFSRQITLSLPQAIRIALVDLHDKPPESLLTPVKEPAPTRHLYLNGERDILLELPRILTFKGQGQISYTAKNRPMQNTLPKIQRNLNLKEFFPETADKRLKTLRTSLLAGMAAYTLSKNETQDTPDLIRSLFQNSYVKSAKTAPLAIPDLKGMGYLEYYDLLSPEGVVLDLLRRLPEGEWIDFENIRNHVRYNLIDIRPIQVYVAENRLHYVYELETERYTETRHFITKDLYYDAVETPFLRGSFFLFAAFGLCDLAYDDPDLDDIGRSCFSSWDGLRYVRRTLLGDYVCGISSEYDASAIASQTRITLSSDTLLISTEESDVAAAALLEPYAEQLGVNRFRTDNQLFLKNIRSKKELEGKIEVFKQVTGGQLPPNWEAFFQDLLHKINPFESPGDVFVFKIPPDNKHLIKIIAQDPVIKSLTAKAEGYLIIIPKNNFAPFKLRLQEFGYLLT
jgi:hypothetical protein